MSRIAIVGGGVAGLSAAAGLAEHGHDILLFEAEDHLGYHASGRSAAMFEESYGNAVVRVLNRATGPELAKLGVLSPRGLLMVATKADETAFLRDAQAMDMTVVSRDDAQRLLPILSEQVRYAAVREGAQDIDTHALLQSFARSAREAGARIETGVRVDAIRPGKSVRAGGSEVEVDLVVNAAGAWADAVATLAGVSPIGLQPFRRSMARLPAPGGRDVSGWPMVFGAGESWYAKPDAGGWIVSPAEEDPSDPMDAWADDMVLAEGLQRYEQHVTEPVTRVETNWAGLRTFAPDRALVIGPDPVEPGFCWFAGQGGYGFQTSVGAAQHLAALVEGRPSPLGDELTKALSPSRFL